MPSSQSRAPFVASGSARRPTPSFRGPGRSSAQIPGAPAASSRLRPAPGFRRGRAVVAGLAAAAALWAAALVAAPYAATHAAPGSAAVLAAAGVYAAGAVVCHQRGARSFHLWDAQVPVCARCAGLYAGAPGGLLLGMLLLPGRGRGPRPAAPDDPRALRRLLIGAAAPTLLTVAVEVPNAPRAWSAVPLGLAVAWIAARTVREALDG